jgi:hypothetical protein
MGVEEYTLLFMPKLPGIAALWVLSRVGESNYIITITSSVLIRLLKHFTKASYSII